MGLRSEEVQSFLHEIMNRDALGYRTIMMLFKNITS